MARLGWYCIGLAQGDTELFHYSQFLWGFGFGGRQVLGSTKLQVLNDTAAPCSRRLQPRIVSVLHEVLVALLVALNCVVFSWEST